MATRDVAIIDAGGANIASLQYALNRAGARSFLTGESRDIQSASHVILPGVGAAADAMERLNSLNLVPVVQELQQPVLGICLGMQLLADASSEDEVRCIGVFPGTAERLSASPDRPVPNMGWCRARALKEHALLEGIDDGSWFYFVHSFALPVSDLTVATAEHTGAFSAIISSNNFHATQFHPERSSRAGLILLRNFLALSS